MSSHSFETAGHRKLQRMIEAIDLLSEGPCAPNQAEGEIEAMVATCAVIETKTQPERLVGRVRADLQRGTELVGRGEGRAVMNDCWKKASLCSHAAILARPAADV
jgi:hypothetical protein